MKDGGAGMIGCGMSRSFTQLLAWRWVTGIGSALQMSGSQLYLADISLSSNRARTMGTNQVRAHSRTCQQWPWLSAMLSAMLMELLYHTYAQQRCQAVQCTEMFAHDGGCRATQLANEY